MAYIYKITNSLNGKSYIGKTNFTLEVRFKQHLHDAYFCKSKNRPLYNAIRKYGENNFSISELEECSAEKASEREIYWIEKLQTYKFGYNATIGGDGKPYLDYEVIKATYLNCKNLAETSRKCGCHEDSVRNILENSGINILSNDEVLRNCYGVIVSQFSLEGEYLQTFASYKEAAQMLIDSHKAKGAKNGVASHIREAATGQRKTAYGYTWKIDTKDQK